MTIMKVLRQLLLATIAIGLCVQGPLARADLVSTDQLITPGKANGDRAKVDAFMERADIQQKLAAMGVNGLIAKERVDALSDSEVHMLALKMDSLPAGGSLSNSDIIIILLIAILLIIVI